jgi:hypothetical protein
MNKSSYLPHYHAINRGYSMLFDEYGIYFTSETGFLIFSRVRRPRLGDRKHNSLDKNHITSQTMGDPICRELYTSLCTIILKMLLAVPFFIGCTCFRTRSTRRFFRNRLSSGGPRNFERGRGRSRNPPPPKKAKISGIWGLEF